MQYTVNVEITSIRVGFCFEDYLEFTSYQAGFFIFQINNSCLILFDFVSKTPIKPIIDKKIEDLEYRV